ncbi:MAG: FtsX-like permease family protein [Gammaproteobacteria bacterium]|jgi:putative ABC transport system permease protein|nr:FtsX-like permease family protein [Gammaproteobacteria bacterium]
MEFGPIWRAMLRNKGGFLLIALQIAVTMTIMVNAIAIIQERSRNIARPSGLDEANTFTLVSVSIGEDMDNKSLIDEDLDLLRGMPGVLNATASNSMPLLQSGWSEGLTLEPGEGKSDSSSALYFADEHTADTFALNFVEGANFEPNQVEWRNHEVNDWPPFVIVSRALAEDLFPDETGSYVGKTFYIDDDNPVNIIGVVERMQAAWQGWSGLERSMLVPQRQDWNFTRYIVRTEPGYREELMPEIEDMLVKSNPDRIIQSVRSMDEVRKLAYLGDAAMIRILTFIVALLTVITGLGIVGLASFNVSRRTRQIGIRRALGATRPAIVRHFMVENLLVSVIGIGVGGILAVALNMFMVEAFALEPLAWYVIPAAMSVLLIVGQLAVAGPARKASNVTPAIATRSV